MRENCTSGTVRGASGNGRPYRGDAARIKMLMRRIRNRLICTLILLFLAGAASADKCTNEAPNTIDGVLQVRYLDVAEAEIRSSTYWDILELALKKSGVAYDLDMSNHYYRPGNNAQQFRKYGAEGNIRVFDSNIDLETELFPVRVPIFLGLRSYLRLWVREDNVEELSGIKTLEDLQKYVILQGPRWLSIPILEAENIEVRTGAFVNLPRMLAQGRADIYLFSAMGQDFLASENNKDLPLLALPNVSVRIQKAQYFYLDEYSKDLHSAIYNGLKVAFEDGSLQDYIRTSPLISSGYDWIKKEDFDVIDIDNPNLTKETRIALDTYIVKD